MHGDLKALVVILVIATAVFAVAKPICLDYMDLDSFKRRRNVWFAVTVLGFLTPSIWLFAAIAMPLTYFAAKRDKNPLAVYVMLMFVIPNSGIPIPTVGIGQLFDITWNRMLALAVLLPVVMRGVGGVQHQSRRLTALDWSLLAYCLLQLGLFVPYESSTNTLRRAFLLFLDTYLIFLAFSRLAPNRRSLEELVMMLCLDCGLLATLGLFESVRGWLLYQSIPNTWGSHNLVSYLLRGDALRAQVTTGHSLALGYTLSLGFGFWLFVMSQRKRAMIDVAITALFCAGIFVSYSRGAWLMAVLLAVVFMALRPGAAGMFAKVLPVLALLGAIAYLSPLKESLIDRLPIIGTSDQETIDYRRKLADVSWQLIQVNPLLGDPFVTRNMEALRQGEGIIDLINGYISVTLFSGFIGLTLFVSFFAIATWRCFFAMRSWVDRDQRTYTLGAVLLSSMLASLFFIATAGVGSIEYFLGGLMAAYVSTTQLSQQSQAPTVRSGLRTRQATS